MADPWESDPVATAPWENDPVEVSTVPGVEPMPVPQAFLNRLARGTAFDRAANGIKESPTPRSIIGDDFQRLAEAGILRDPITGEPGMVYPHSQDSPKPSAWEQIKHALASDFTRLIESTKTLPMRAFGASEMFRNEGELNVEPIIEAGAFGITPSAALRVARPRVVEGRPDPQVVGDLPKEQDFKNAAITINPAGTFATEAKLRELWQERGIHPAEAAHDAQGDAMLAHDLSSAAAVPDDLPPLISPDVQPLSQPGVLGAKFRAAMDKGFDLGKDIQMNLAPMAVGDNIIAKAVSKDFANALRANDWDMARWISDIDKKYTPAEQAEMWLRLDEQSQWLASGENAPPGVGLSALRPELRAEVEKVMTNNQADWLRATDLGIVKGQPVPAYAARIAVNVKHPDMPSHVPINSIGLNLKTATSRFRQRKYQTVEETEAALKAKYPEAEIARNIKANIIAMKQTRDAIAGRTFVEKIKDYGSKTGNETVAEGFKPAEGWFTIDHPALKTWKPKFAKQEDGTWGPVRSENGDLQFEQVPIYINKDWEGPLRAVLSTKPSAVASALMDAKSKVMSVIMYSPFIHNSVIFSKAMAGFKGNVIKTTKLYFDGNRIKNDPAQMMEAISDGGMVPVGKRFFKQDITDQMTQPSMTPGDSMTARMLSAVPGLFSEGAELATKKAIDKLGNFYHNTLLWDRVADLQAGVYAHFRDEFISSGMDRQTAVRMAGHEANRLAGSLPVESMSQGARAVANTLLFSRTFTLGNIGIMKDMLTGLPKDVLAQIERDAGPNAATTAKAMARRQAISTVVTDMALFYVGTSIMQNAANIILFDSTISDEAAGYWTRLQKQLNAKASNPWSAVPPWGIYSFLQGLSATSANEPGRQDRVLMGYTSDGTAIYGKSPLGRIGEEFSGYTQGFWSDLFHRKMGTFVRPVWDFIANDRGFGRKLYEPHVDSATGALDVAWQVAKHFAESQLPTTQLQRFGDLVKGEGDQKLNLLATVGPFLPPPFTLTASKGAPGGPRVGLYYDQKSQQDFRVQQAMPGIRQMIQRGDMQGANSEMNRLKMPPSYQNWVRRTTLNPALRLSSRALRDFHLYASPEAQERMQNMSPLAPQNQQ